MLTEMCSEHNAGIVSLTESHLHSDIRDAEISIPGYELYRCDRHGAKNDGVVTCKVIIKYGNPTNIDEVNWKC